MKVSLEMLMALAIIVLLSACAGQSQDDEGENSFEPFPTVHTGDTVIEPPQGVHPFYRKYVNADGIVIVGSENVADAALLTARSTILRFDQQASRRPPGHRGE